MVLVILGVVLIAGAAFVTMKKPGTTTTNTSNQTGNNQLPPPTLIEVPFEYTVKSVTASEIVLNGQEGDITFPTNFAMTYINGDRGSKEATTLSALRVGQKVNLDMIPGQSATIYILNSK